MSFDESVLAGVALVGSLFVVLRSGWTLGAARRFRCGASLLLAPPGALLAGCGIIVWTPLRWAAQEVRGDGGEVAVLTGVGLVWMSVVSGCLALLGVSLRVHAVERKNPAALAAWCGAVLGAALCYAGGSIGDGPAMSENIFCAALATLAMLAGWLVVDFGAGLVASITIERDVASGVRAGAFLLAEGLIAGRAVAGDWESAAATLTDFAHDAWPLLPLALAALVVERALRPGAESGMGFRIHPVSEVRPGSGTPLAHGVLPALAYLAAAATWLLALGKWKTHP